jgi:hypothetical protein
MPPEQGAVLQLSPGFVQMPQLELQHTCPTLQVFGPHCVLDGTVDMPHTSCEQRSPGCTQVPQLALQHTSPGAQIAAPQVTPGCSAAATAGVSPSFAAPPSAAAAVAASASSAAPASWALASGGASMGGSTLSTTGGSAGNGSTSSGGGAATVVGSVDTGAAGARVGTAVEFSAMVSLASGVRTAEPVSDVAAGGSALIRVNERRHAAFSWPAVSAIAVLASASAMTAPAAPA